MARPRLKQYLRLVKFSHSVFALPFALASAALAAHEGVLPSWPRILLIVIAVVAARTAAMAFNRLVDVRYDRQNPRTIGRELVTGIIGHDHATRLVVLSSLCFLLTSIAISPLCGLLAPLVLGILFGYSYTKRFTWACHLFLGMALGLAPLGAWIAIRGTVGLPAVVLALAVLTWVSGFDVLYALSDIEFDRRTGLHSIPARFGIEGSLLISAALHLGTIICLAGLGAIAGLGWIYWSGLCGVLLLLAYEHFIVQPRDLSRLDTAFFTLNGYVSIGYLVFTVVDLLV